MPYILSWFERNDRIDIVLDLYFKTSFKSGLREQRGSVARRRVTFSTKIPYNGSVFFRVDVNKQELFVKLVKKKEIRNSYHRASSFLQQFLVIVQVRFADPDVDAVAPCTYEEGH